MLNWMKDVKAAQRRFQGEFRNLVRAVTDEMPPEPETIARILQDNGKSVQDLEAAVKLLQHRRELRKQIDESAVLERERPGLKRKIAEANAVLAKADQVHEDTVYSLQMRLREIDAANSAAGDARRELESTCNDMGLRGELVEVDQQRIELTNQRAKVQHQRDQLRSAGQHDLEEAKRQLKLDDEKFFRTRGESRLAKVAELDKGIADLDSKLAKLQEREQSIRERMIQS